MILVAIPQRYGLPAVPSDPDTCGRCGGAVWVSKRADRATIDGILCVVCAMAVVKPGDLVDAAPWVVADLAEALGDG